MTQYADLFKPEVIFSLENPFLKSVAAMHRAVFETMDKAARAQLAFAEELLDINRDRFELLYAGKSLTETMDAQQDLITEFGKCAARYVGDLKEIAESMGADLTEAMADAANEAAGGAESKPRSGKSKKAA